MWGFIAIIVLALSIYVYGKGIEKYRWNEGRCRKCSSIWHYCGMNSAGTRRYKCEFGHNIKISRLDEIPVNPKKTTLKVKIGSKIHDSSKEPIMLILSDEDKFNISHMEMANNRYCSFPDDMDKNKAKEFMEGNE